MLEKYNPGSVKHWNLKCFGRGRGNDPGYWAGTINKIMPDFNTDRFIIVGDKCPEAADLSAGTDNLISLLNSFKEEPALGGAFIWTLDTIVSKQNNSKSLGTSMKDYADAITRSLNSINSNNVLIRQIK